MKSDRENKEWLNEYPSLKQVVSNDPFTVPDGYFHGLEERIISCVRVSELVSPSSPNFTVPDNYFEELNNNILSRIAIEEVVSADDKSFTVPENYFEDMAAQISSRIAIDEAVNHPFTVPQGYFDDMHTQVTSRIAVNEALNMPFTVPENYFNDLSRNILNQTAGLDTIQRRGIVRKLVSSAAFKYASAACFALIIGVGIFITQITSKPADDRSDLHKALSEVSANDIEGYLQLHVDANDPKNAPIDKTDKNDLNTISVDDLKDYLNNN